MIYAGHLDIMFRILFVVSVVTVPFVTGKGQCKLPIDAASKEFVVPKGDLFQILDVSDSYDRAFGCKIVRGVTKTKTGFKVEIYNAGTGSTSGTLEFIVQADGTYEINPASQKKLGQYLEKAIDPGMADDAEKEMNEIFDKGTVVFTIQDKFVFGLSCDDENRKIVLVKSTDPNPTAADILLIHNELASIGGGWSEVQLHLTGCDFPK